MVSMITIKRVMITIGVVLMVVERIKVVIIIIINDMLRILVRSPS